MKMNVECVRDVLLTVETYRMNTVVSIEDLCANLPKYANDDIEYTCLKLEEAGYLKIVKTDDLNRCLPEVIEIIDITYRGHEFLNTVRPQTVWEKTVSAIGKIGGTSLPVVLEAAKDIAIRLITAQP